MRVTLRDGFPGCAGPIVGPNHTCPGGVCDDPPCVEGEWVPGGPDPDFCGHPAGGDTFNGGCNSPLEVFTPIKCGYTICGTSASALGGGGGVRRDTDWYEIHVTSNTLLTVHVTAEFRVQIGIITSLGTGECCEMPPCPELWAADGYVYDECNEPWGDDPAQLELCVGPGYWWVFVGIDPSEEELDCSDYTVRVACEPYNVACCIGNDTCEDLSATSCTYGDPPNRDRGTITGPDCGPEPEVQCAWGCSDPLQVHELDCTCPDTGGACRYDDGWTNNTGLTDHANPPMGFRNSENIGVLWFSFVAEAESVLISTCDTPPPPLREAEYPIFALYEGDCLNSLIELELASIWPTWLCGGQRIVFSGDAGSGTLDTTGDALHNRCPSGHIPSNQGEICYYGLNVGQTYFIQLASWASRYQGQYVLDIQCPCPYIAPAACCMPDGTCTVADAPTCTELGGAYQGGETHCTDPDVCDWGACCLADGTCVPDTTEAFCDLIGGVDWISGIDCGATPADNPCAGACCTWELFQQRYTCTNATEQACQGFNDTFYPGEECRLYAWGLFECPDHRTCQTTRDDTGKCQFPSPDAEGNFPQNVVAGGSDRNPQFGPGRGNHRADDFVPLEPFISTVCWWGIYRDTQAHVDPPGTELLDNFTVTYYQSDANGCPITPPVATFREDSDPPTLILAPRVPTGKRVLPEPPEYPEGHLEYIYQGTHEPLFVVPGDCYWVEIVNNTDDGTGVQSRVWLWSTSPWVDGNGFSLSEWGQPGAGFDCYESPSWCQYDLAFCLDINNDPCVHCTQICAGGETPEGEPTCYDYYVDTYNIGCSALVPSVPPAMTDITCGQAVCGESGT